jgi:hypothetical protein
MQQVVLSGTAGWLLVSRSGGVAHWLAGWSSRGQKKRKGVREAGIPLTRARGGSGEEEGCLHQEGANRLRVFWGRLGHGERGFFGAPERDMEGWAYARGHGRMTQGWAGP